jgi:Guanosine polyphosphate pyrophosphohydrolases/synthetases
MFGKQILDSFFVKENYELNKSTINKIKKDFKLSDIEDLYELVGSGNMTAVSVLKKIYPEFNYKSGNKFKNESENSIKLKGLTAGMSYHLSGCCSPIKGDTIVGIVTAGIGVAVHTVDCETLSSYNDNPERWLNISWDNSVNKNTVSNSRLNVVLKNQPGSLGKVTTIIAKNNGNISNINFQ